MNDSIKKIISDIAYKCYKNKINFRLEHCHNVDMDELPCSGYFDEKSLVVATDKNSISEWISTLIHESCHLDQFIEKSPYWIPDNVGVAVVENWLNKKNYSKKRLLEAFSNTMSMELDCEKRSIKTIKKYKLYIDIKNYIQQANAYIFSYVYSYKNRKWFVNPYENSNIVKSMPVKFLNVSDYFKLYEKVSFLYERPTTKSLKKF